MTSLLRIWRVLEGWIRAYLAKARVSLGMLFALLQRLSRLGARRFLSRSERNVHQPSQPRAFFATSSIPRLPTPLATDDQDAQSYLPDGAQTNSPQQLSPVPQRVTRIVTPPPTDPLDGAVPSQVLPFTHLLRAPIGQSSPHATSMSAGNVRHGAHACNRHWSAHDTLGLALKSAHPIDWKTPPTQSTQPSDKFLVRIKSPTPTYATMINRYGRELPPEEDMKATLDADFYTVGPLTTDYDDDDAECQAADSAGWKRVVHPEGALYWFHQQQRVFTDAPMADPRYREAASQSIAKLRRKINDSDAHQRDIPEDAELVLELELRPKPTPGNDASGGHDTRKRYRFNVWYYFVTHKTRRIFWLEKFNLTPLFENLKGVKSRAHMGLAVEQQYWQHCELFPYNRPVAKNIIEELKEIVFHYISEMITSDTSLTPFNEDELSKIRDVVEHAQEVEGETFDHSICIIARLMRTLTRNRFFHFHGETVARLNSDQPLFAAEDKKIKVSKLTRVSMLLLFNAPHSHLRRLRSVWIDKVVNQVPWKKFVNELNTEWRGYTLYSTVLLAVNLSLLALYNVMPQGSTNSGMHPQTVAEIMSYVSTTWSVGSVVTSLVLVRQNETNSRQSIDEAVEFLNIVSSNKHGIEMLAIIYSLPFGFLLWGLLFFSMAFLALAFQDTLAATRVCVTLASFITLALVIWPVVVARDFLTKRFWMNKKKLLEDAWKYKDVELFLDAFGLSLPRRNGPSSKKQGKPLSRTATRADTAMTVMSSPPEGTTTHGAADVEEPPSSKRQGPGLLARVVLTFSAMALGNAEGPVASALSMNAAPTAGAEVTPAADSSATAACDGVSPNEAQELADPPARQPSMLKRAFTKLGFGAADWQGKRKKKMDRRSGSQAAGTQSRARMQTQPQSRSRTMQPGEAIELGYIRSREQVDGSCLGGPDAEERV